MQEIKPKLEVNKKYCLGQCSGAYLGHVIHDNTSLHVFSIQGKEEKLYVLYDDKWICESEEEVIAHNLYAPILPKVLHNKNIEEKDSGLFNLIKNLEESG